MKWGWIDVKKMTLHQGENLTQKMEFIHPDDENAEDRTVIRVPLSKPILPGRTAIVDVEFEAQLPTIVARTGYYKNFVMAAQWFPKIGVYEKKGDRYATTGQWNCHQFHSETEFFADYGVYDVSITLPKNYVTGAVGLLQSEKENPDSTKTVMYHAEDVHDFSWTASPDFVAVEDQWKNVKIRLLTQAYKVPSVSNKHIESVKGALQKFNELVGEYPYPNLTIVDPPRNADHAGGMEYPSLITTLSIWGLPSKIHLNEAVTIHEFGHQYFYGMLGSNEFEEAWLDEGFTQYFETRIMNALYGEKKSMIDLLGFGFDDLEFTRWEYTDMINPKLAPTLQNAWQYTAGGYDEFTYFKSTMILTTLERMIGQPVMDEVIHVYFDRWKFKHPCTRDFIAVVNEVVLKNHGNKFGDNMNWFFDQVLSGTDICDYELSRIDVHPVARSAGIFDSANIQEKPDSTLRSKHSTMFDSRIIVSRLGEIKLPLDVLIHFEDGTEVRESWDGQARWKEFNYTGKAKVVWAKADPDGVLALDINQNNNSRTLEVNSLPFWKYTAKFMTFVQSILQWTALF